MPYDVFAACSCAAYAPYGIPAMSCTFSENGVNLSHVTAQRHCQSRGSRMRKLGTWAVSDVAVHDMMPLKRKERKVSITEYHDNKPNSDTHACLAAAS